MDASSNNDCLKIGDVSRLVGLSPTVIRMWERLGLTAPRRTPSKYRLYSREDVGLLKRASFLRKVRGMNASAIVQTLKREGVVQPAHAPDGALGSRLRQLRLSKGQSLASVAKAVGVSVGFLSALERSQMSA
jgi:DNA-binding transcriptional MerR regulator